jgi:hypothetical protein
MITQANQRKLQGVAGLQTISALTHRQLVELLQRKVITPELFDEQAIAEVLDPEDPKKRYCLCRNPETAKRETHTRQNLLALTRQHLEAIALGRSPKKPTAGDRPVPDKRPTVPSSRPKKGPSAGRSPVVAPRVRDRRVGRSSEVIRETRRGQAVFMAKKKSMARRAARRESARPS